MDKDKFLKLNSLELTSWLQENGVDVSYCDILEGKSSI